MVGLNSTKFDKNIKNSLNVFKNTLCRINCALIKLKSGKLSSHYSPNNWSKADRLHWAIKQGRESSVVAEYPFGKRRVQLTNVGHSHR